MRAVYMILRSTQAYYLTTRCVWATKENPTIPPIRESTFNLILRKIQTIRIKVFEFFCKLNYTLLADILIHHLLLKDLVRRVTFISILAE
jgi:hypothetical protein